MLCILPVAKVRSLLATSGGTLLVDRHDEDSISPHTEVVRALLSRGAKVDLQTNKGNTPLLIACLEGHTEVVPDISWSQGQPAG